MSSHLKKSRKFGDKRFKLYKVYKKKSDANKEKKRKQDRKMFVRMVKTADGWAVYYRKTK